MIEGLFVLALYIIWIIAVFIIGDLVITFYNAVVDKPIKDDVRRVIIKEHPRDVIDDLVEGKLDPRPEDVKEKKPIRKFVF